MKKLVSLLALCALCIGAVAMVTACGSKPAKKSVWKVTTSTYKSNRSGDQAPKVTKPDDYYICFHSDGMAYYTEKENGKLVARKMGLYRMDAKKKTMIIGANDWSYTLEKNSLTLVRSLIAPDGTNDGSITYVCTLVTSPTEKEIKDALKK